jgi:peptidoglycan-associated lipoprotein
MTHTSRAALAAALAALAILAGCGTTTSLDEKGAPVETRTLGLKTPAAPGSGAATSGSAAQSQVATVDLAAQQAAEAAAKAQRIVYFDFDSFAIKDEYKPVIEANAKRLVARPARQMVVEGHTDDRGGSEYNLALGQKRAEAVVKALELLGVADKQLEAVSFGKERPAVAGTDDAARAQNRRAELRDR